MAKESVGMAVWYCCSTDGVNRGKRTTNKIPLENYSYHRIWIRPGTKAFSTDFFKLAIVNAEKIIYINGVKRFGRKEDYVPGRIELVKSFLKNQTGNSNYIICFVDHPSLWEGKNEIFIQIHEL